MSSDGSTHGDPLELREPTTSECVGFLRRLAANALTDDDELTIALARVRRGFVYTYLGLSRELREALYEDAVAAARVT